MNTVHLVVYCYPECDNPQCPGSKPLKVFRSVAAAEKFVNQQEKRHDFVIMSMTMEAEIIRSRGREAMEREKRKAEITPHEMVEFVNQKAKETIERVRSMSSEEIGKMFFDANVDFRLKNQCLQKASISTVNRNSLGSLSLATTISLEKDGEVKVETNMFSYYHGRKGSSRYFFDITIFDYIENLFWKQIGKASPERQNIYHLHGQIGTRSLRVDYVGKTYWEVDEEKFSKKLKNKGVIYPYDIVFFQESWEDNYACYGRFYVVGNGEYIKFGYAYPFEPIDVDAETIAEKSNSILEFLRKMRDYNIEVKRL